MAPQSKGVFCAKLPVHNYTMMNEWFKYVDAFGMTKLHKDIAMRLMECVKDESMSDQAVIKVRQLTMANQ